MLNFCSHLPINSVSFGQVSTLFLKTYFDKFKDNKTAQLDEVAYISNPDVSSWDLDENFASWIRSLNENFSLSHDRTKKCFKLWHLNGSLEAVCNDTLLLTFYELNDLTPAEVNIAKNNRIALSSKYAQEAFKAKGIETTYIPLGFDDYNFKRLDKKFFPDDRIVFNVTGKFEKRKHHAKLIKAWLKKFGNDRRYCLQAALFNPHLPDAEKQYQALIQSLTENKNYFNVNFLGPMQKNSVYNDFLNAGDIILGMSGAEGWGLPEFQSVAIGKHSVILNAHSYKEWATNENSILVDPSCQIDSEDGFFFKKGAPFNQGTIFDFEEDDFISACEQAVKRVEASRINEAGFKLQKDFSKEKFVENILSAL